MGFAPSRRWPPAGAAASPRSGGRLPRLLAPSSGAVLGAAAACAEAPLGSGLGPDGPLLALAASSLRRLGCAPSVALAGAIPYAPSGACLVSACGPRLRRFAWVAAAAAAVFARAGLGLRGLRAARRLRHAPPLRLPALSGSGSASIKGWRGLGCAPAGALGALFGSAPLPPRALAAAAAGLGCAAAAAREENKDDLNPRPMVHSSHPSPGISPPAYLPAPTKECKRSPSAVGRTLAP